MCHFYCGVSAGGVYIITCGLAMTLPQMTATPRMDGFWPLFGYQDSKDHPHSPMKSEGTLTVNWHFFQRRKKRNPHFVFEGQLNQQKKWGGGQLLITQKIEAQNFETVRFFTRKALGLSMDAPSLRRFDPLPTPKVPRKITRTTGLVLKKLWCMGYWQKCCGGYGIHI